MTIGLLDLVKSTTLSVHTHLLVIYGMRKMSAARDSWWVFPFSLLRVQRRAILFVLKANRSLHVVVGLGYLFLLWFCTLLCSCNPVRDDWFFFIYFIWSTLDTSIFYIKMRRGVWTLLFYYIYLFLARAMCACCVVWARIFFFNMQSILCSNANLVFDTRRFTATVTNLPRSSAKLPLRTLVVWVSKSSLLQSKVIYIQV